MKNRFLLLILLVCSLLLTACGGIYLVKDNDDSFIGTISEISETENGIESIIIHTDEADDIAVTIDNRTYFCSYVEDIDDSEALGLLNEGVSVTVYCDGRNGTVNDKDGNSIKAYSALTVGITEIPTDSN